MIVAEIVAPGVIGLDVTGKLERDDIEAAIVAVEEALDRFGDIALIVDLTGYAGITASALIADMRYGMSHLDQLDRYKRIAVISGHAWIDTLAWLESKLVRSVDIRRFPPDERHKAKVFAMGGEIPHRRKEPAIVRIATDRADVFAFRVTDHVGKHDAHALFGFLAEAWKRSETIDLMVIIEDYDGFDRSLLADPTVWKGKAAGIARIRRYAVVGGPAAIRNAAVFFGAFLPVDIRSFERGNESEAWHWLSAAPLVAY